MERPTVFIFCFNELDINVDALEKLIRYGVSVGLRYEPTEHPLLIVEDPFSFTEHRKRLAEIMFEKIGFPAIYFMKSAPCIGYNLISFIRIVTPWVRQPVCPLISVPVESALSRCMTVIP